ncbi:MAG: mandelate racemase/muconate lactonizing enzyme family protein [Armatimonadetes bacterium]|nr:mandelate racemase/muconate lactonizing enzyme family protein [Armatimonadota bacterium]
MKITRIRGYRPPGANPLFNQSNLVVAIETDAGLTGIGDGGSRDTLAQCGAMLIGQDPARIQHLWQFMYRGWFYPPGREKLHALGALDLALWDLKGKALGVPVYELLGGLTRDYIECYSGFPWQGTFRETARACIEAGFRAYRTAVADPEGGIFDARRMIRLTADRCAEIAEGVGPDGDWMIDFHTRLDLADAVRLCTLLEPMEPLFVEDPLRSENQEALASLRGQVRCPIAAGEQYGDRWDSNTLIERRLLDYTRVTLPNVGGLSEWVKLAALCETHYVGMVPHFTGPVATAALVHALAAFPGPALMEYAYGGRPFPYLLSGFEFRQGKFWPARRPGLGVEFDPFGTEQALEVTEYDAPIPIYRRPDGSLTNW